MPTPLDPLVAEMVELLDANQREEFEERAGIVEFDGQLPRAHAECLALLVVLHRHPTALICATVLQVEIDGYLHWLLTANAENTRQYLAEIGGTGLCVVGLTDILNLNFGGTAWLVKGEH